MQRCTSRYSCLVGAFKECVCSRVGLFRVVFREMACQCTPACRPYIHTPIPPCHRPYIHTRCTSAAAPRRRASRLCEKADRAEATIAATIAGSRPKSGEERRQPVKLDSAISRHQLSGSNNLDWDGSTLRQTSDALFRRGRP